MTKTKKLKHLPLNRSPLQTFMSRSDYKLLDPDFFTAFWGHERCKLCISLARPAPHDRQLQMQSSLAQDTSLHKTEIQLKNPHLSNGRISEKNIFRFTPPCWTVNYHNCNKVFRSYNMMIIPWGSLQKVLPTGKSCIS